MSAQGFAKSVHLFRKFSEESLRRRGGDRAGRDGVEALSALEAVLKSERLLDGTLLEPLAAFTGLLQSSELPPELGHYSFGDALLAVETAHAELRKNAAQIWEFAPELAESAPALRAFVPERGAEADSGQHRKKLADFALQAAQSVEPGSLLIVGALSAPELPLAALTERFQRVTLSDLELPALEALVRKHVPERQRERIRLERYDLTGSYAAFAAGVDRAVSGATDVASAERALLELIQSYDVDGRSAGLSSHEQAPDLALSAMVLSELGRGYARYVAQALTARGFEDRSTRAPLEPALTLLRTLVAQHHVQALLRRAKSAALISVVSELRLPAQPEPTDVLEVEHLTERLPHETNVRAEESWEWQRPLPGGDARASLVSLVEAVLI